MTALIFALTIAVFQEPEIDWGRPFFGVTVESIEPDSRKRLKSDLEKHFKVPDSRIGVAIGSKGAIVTEVHNQFEGLVNNLQKMDVIQKVGETEVGSKDELLEVLKTKEPGQQVTFSILRPALIKNRVSFEEKTVQCTPTSNFLQVMNQYSVDDDKFKKITFYSCDSMRRSPMSLYVGKHENGEIYQMARFRCEEIIGLQSVRISVDGEFFDIELTLQEKLDNTVIGRPSYQWFDRNASELTGMLKRIESAKEVSIRMNGRGEVRDFDVKDSVLLNMKLNKSLIEAIKWKDSQDK